MNEIDPVVRLIGEETFSWLCGTFDRRTTFCQLPGDLLDRLASLDPALRDYSQDRDAVTAIAMITFCYRMAGRRQPVRDAGKDLLLLKILALKEAAVREGAASPHRMMTRIPVCELITGEVGERIRKAPCMNSPA